MRGEGGLRQRFQQFNVSLEELIDKFCNRFAISLGNALEPSARRAVDIDRQMQLGAFPEKFPANPSGIIVLAFHVTPSGIASFRSWWLCESSPDSMSVSLLKVRLAENSHDIDAVSGSFENDPIVTSSQSI